MNTTIDDILTRRSVREFQKKGVDRETLREILRAGFAAPSAHGKRPFRVAVLEDPAIREGMTAVMKWFRPIVEAPVALLVLGDPTVCVQKEYWVVDCAAFTENILVAARSRSLGTVWCGIAPSEGNIKAIRSVLDIPDPWVPFAAVAMGHPLDPGAFGERSFDDEANIVWNPPWLKTS